MKIGFKLFSLSCIALLMMQMSFAKSIAVTFRHIPPSTGKEPPSAYLYFSAVKINGGHRTSPYHGLFLGQTDTDKLYYTPIFSPDASGEYELGLACAYKNLPYAIPPHPLYPGTMVWRHFILTPKDPWVLFEASCPVDANGKLFPRDIRISTPSS